MPSEHHPANATGLASVPSIAAKSAGIRLVSWQRHDRVQALYGGASVILALRPEFLVAPMLIIGALVVLFVGAYLDDWWKSRH
jgi:hypothetical protein